MSKLNRDAKIWVWVFIFVFAVVGYTLGIEERWDMVILDAMALAVFGIIIYPWKGPIGR